MTEKRIRTIEADCGEPIKSYINRLIDEKKRRTEHPFIEGNFNGVLFQVTNVSTEEELLAFFEAEIARQRAAYLASDAYKERQQKEEIERKKQNEEASVLIDQLRVLDFSTYTNVLFWVKEYQPYSNRSGVTVPKEEILTLFTTNGFIVNANTHKQFDEEDAENYARWIIGQALDGIQKIGAMHPMVVTFTERWEEKFSVSQ